MDPVIRYWDISSRTLVAESIGHVAAVKSLGFSPDGSSLASASSDRTIRLWDTLTGDLQAVLRGPNSAVSEVAFLPDGRTHARELRKWAGHSVLGIVVGCLDAGDLEPEA